MKKDTAAITVLSTLGLLDEPQLSPEQEMILRDALDKEQAYLTDIEKLFGEQPINTSNINNES